MAYLFLTVKAKSMPYAGATNKLVALIRDTWCDPKGDATPLFNMLTNWFKHWKYLLKQPEYEKDVVYVSMCHKLNSPTIPGHELIKYWIHYVEKELGMDLIEELQITFLEFLRSLRYWPPVANPIVMELVVANGFKHALIRKIKSVRTLNIKAMPPAELVEEPIHPDYLFIRNLNLTAWERYLIEITFDEHSSRDRADLAVIARKTFEVEEKQLWNRVSQLWRDAEILPTKKRS
jgi:hypothetical protein